MNDQSRPRLSVIALQRDRDEIAAPHLLRLPTFNIGECCIDERFEICIGPVRFRHEARLSPAFLGESGKAGVRHPNLHRAQPRRAQGLPLLSNPRGRGCTHDLLQKGLLQVTLGHGKAKTGDHA